MVVALAISMAAIRHREVRRALRREQVRLRRMRVALDERVGRVAPPLTGVAAVVAELAPLVALRRRLAETVATAVSRRLPVRASRMAEVAVAVVETRVSQAPRRSLVVVAVLAVVALVRSRPGMLRLWCVHLEMEQVVRRTPVVAVVEAVTAPRT